MAGKKRQFGSIRRLTSNRFQARYTNPVTGELIKAPSTFKTKAEADTWLAKIQTELACGEWRDPTTTVTVG